MLRSGAAAAVLISVLAGCGESEQPGDACEPDDPAVAFDRSPADAGPGLAEVVIRSVDGTEEVVTGDWVATAPSFSPDGERLAVVRAEGDYESAGPSSTSLWLIDLDSGDRRALTSGETSQFDDQPAWSPDGSVIAFSRATTGQGELRFALHVVDVESGQVREVTDGARGEDRNPAWSPDGSTLAFARGAAGTDGAGRGELWVVAADGSGERRVAEIDGAETISWHPDGSTLLVAAAPTYYGASFLVNVDTGDVERIDTSMRRARWAADGRRAWFLLPDGSDPDSWMLAHGELDGAELRIQDQYDVGIWFLYPYFGLDVAPCG